MEAIGIDLVQEKPPPVESPAKFDSEAIGDFTLEIAGVGVMLGHRGCPPFFEHYNERHELCSAAPFEDVKQAQAVTLEVFHSKERNEDDLFVIEVQHDIGYGFFIHIQINGVSLVALVRADPEPGLETFLEVSNDVLHF
jgi:hypothetical protein